MQPQQQSIVRPVLDADIHDTCAAQVSVPTSAETWLQPAIYGLVVLSIDSNMSDKAEIASCCGSHLAYSWHALEDANTSRWLGIGRARPPAPVAAGLSR